MKKRFLLLFLFTFAFPLSGCWDLTELNELSIVTGIGIDKGQNYKYSVTVEVLNPPALAADNQGRQSASMIMTTEGNSIGEILKKTNVVYTRKMIYSHLRVIVISAEVAKDGFLEFLEYLESDREIRNDFNFTIVENGSAEDILKIMYPIQKVSSLKINTQLQTMVEEWGGDPDIRKKDFINALLSPGREPVAAQIKIIGSPEVGNSIENIEKIKIDSYVELQGLALFKDMKYIGVLPVSGARNYLLLNNNLNKTSLTVNCGENTMATARIFHSATTIKAKYKNGIPHFKVRTELEGLVENTQCPDDFTKMDTYQKYEKKFSEGFEKELFETIKIMQEQHKADIFGFGEHMERQDYKNFKKVKENWNEEFAKAEFDFNVKVRLRRSGITTKPFILDLK